MDHSVAAGMAIRAVELDFDARVETEHDLDGALAAVGAGRFTWIDVDAADPAAARDLLRRLRVPDEVAEGAASGEATTQHTRHPSCLHLVLSGCRMRDSVFDLERLDVVISEHYLVTLRSGRVGFLDSVKRSYRDDFQHHARTPSFLIYELWDHLLDNYTEVQKRFEERVEAMQSRLIGDVDKDVFAELSELGGDLLRFRRVLLPGRAVLTDLSTRKSRFVSEATQPFLAGMVGRLERVLQDLLVDREILAESLNLYLSMVGHRTNEVMRRLTAVSVVFLPLTFLAGVYGMNFDVMPELRWAWGYPVFWTVALLMAVGLMALLARKRLL